jgi:hypothetical protein
VPSRALFKYRDSPATYPHPSKTHRFSLRNAPLPFAEYKGGHLDLKKPEILSAKKNGHSFLFQLGNLLLEMIDNNRGQTLGGLVEEEKF